MHLACALLASGSTPAQIMALCRWQTEESLAIYARLGEADYTRLLEQSLYADISSVSTANLPVLGAQTALLDLRRERRRSNQGLARACQPYSCPLGRVSRDLSPERQIRGLRAYICTVGARPNGCDGSGPPNPAAELRLRTERHRRGCSGAPCTLPWLTHPVSN